MRIANYQLKIEKGSRLGRMAHQSWHCTGEARSSARTSRCRRRAVVQLIQIGKICHQTMYSTIESSPELKLRHFTYNNYSIVPNNLCVSLCHLTSCTISTVAPPPPRWFQA